MKKIRHLAIAIVALTLAGMATGCATYRPLQINPIGKKGLSSAVVVPKFTTSYYYYDRDQNVFFVMRSHTTDKATGKSVDQIATVRVFWRPVGGKTSMNPTSLNATYRYVVMTPDSVGMYEGAGFVRLLGKNGRPRLDARLLDGDLRLTQASTSFVDTLGRARIRGNFSAKYDDAQAMDMLLAAHQEFFARSLLSKPPAAATQPGETRDTDTSTTQPGDDIEPGVMITPP